MTNKTQISNIALSNLGASKITDYTEDSTSGERIRAVYDALRDAVLQEHPWNFAIQRTILAPSSETPPFEFAYKAKLPIDYLKDVDAFSDSKCFNRIKYKIEAGYLLSDCNTVYFKYVSKVENESLFSPLFVQAFAARMSYELCFPITNSYTVQEQMYKLYTQKLSIARSIDGLEGVPDEIDDEGDGTWIGARR